MTRCSHRSLFAVLAAVSVPAAALAQPATAPTRSASDATTDPALQDRDALAAAEQLAAEASQTIERWIATQAIIEDRLFARLYFPIHHTTPQQYATPYEALADRDLTAVEDKALAKSPIYQYAIVTDLNSYVPAHNSRFAQALTGDLAQDYTNNRTKRMLADPASLAAARSEARSLLQRVRLETGEVISDISVPITVRGKHWGCVRIGYRRTE
jgi:hypothetical protein